MWHAAGCFSISSSLWHLWPVGALFASGLLNLRAAQPPNPPIVTENGIVYGKGGDRDLQLDLSRPGQGKGPFPGLVWIHGGGWGFWPTPRDQCPIEPAARRGYVAVTIDFRLTSVRDPQGKVKYPFPAQLEDVKGAIRWLRANAREYHLDPDRIGVVGYSSGGHLALLAGMTEPGDGFEGQGNHAEVSSRVKVVAASGAMVEAVAFHDQTRHAPERVELLLGGPPDQVPARYRAASPLTYVRKQNPPVLLIQGDKDDYCPPAQAQLLKEKMKSVGASCTLIVKKDQGHETFFDAPELWTFLDRNLKPRSPGRKLVLQGQ